MNVYGAPNAGSLAQRAIISSDGYPGSSGFTSKSKYEIKEVVTMQACLLGFLWNLMKYNGCEIQMLELH